VALLTAVRDRRALLALHPPKGNYTALQPLTGAAKYAWGARARRHKDREWTSRACRRAVTGIGFPIPALRRTAERDFN